MKTETWRDIPGYEGRYQISDFGRVWSSYHQRLLTCKKAGKGYRAITLCTKGQKQRFYIHRLVAFAFLPKPDDESYEVNHKDLNKTNNHALNLEWVSRRDNFEHAYVNGRVDFRRPRRSDNKTGANGVCSHSGGYEVSIGYNRNRHYIGWYKDLNVALKARSEAERYYLCKS